MLLERPAGEKTDTLPEAKVPGIRCHSGADCGHGEHCEKNLCTPGAGADKDLAKLEQELSSKLGEVEQLKTKVARLRQHLRRE